MLAVELHPARVAALRERYAGPYCRVIPADVTRLRLPQRPFRVVANPPFAVLATLLRRLTARDSLLQRADLVVPAQVAARWSRGAAPGVRATSRFTAYVACRLPDSAFHPPATQGTAVLVIARR